MREGSLEAPTRHPIAWQDPDFTDEAKTEAEMRRIFDICHGCRRCFNLCDSFPRLFDLIDNSPTGELDGVPVADYQAGRRRLHAVRHVLHDEVPLCAAARVQSRFPASDAALPRGRADRGQGVRWSRSELGKTDRNGKLGGAGRAARQLGQRPRQHADPAGDGKGRRMSIATPTLPKFHGRTFALRAKRRRAAGQSRTRRPSAARRCSTPPASSTTTTRDRRGDARGAGPERRRDRGRLSRLLRHAATGARAISPSVAAAARKVATALGPWIDKGYDIIALVPSCALMLKFEWPLIVPDDPGGQAAVRGDLRRQPNTSSTSPARRGWRPGCSRSTAASRCTSPAMRARRTWARRRPRCCACCRTPDQR